MTIEHFHITVEEHVALIKSLAFVPSSFGPSGVWLTWDTDEPMPPEVRRLAELRGVMTENLGGNGI